jgi:hypothetical protein
MGGNSLSAFHFFFKGKFSKAKVEMILIHTHTHTHKTHNKNKKQTPMFIREVQILSFFIVILQLLES